MIVSFNPYSSGHPLPPHLLPLPPPHPGLPFAPRELPPASSAAAAAAAAAGAAAGYPQPPHMYPYPYPPPPPPPSAVAGGPEAQTNVNIKQESRLHSVNGCCRFFFFLLSISLLLWLSLLSLPRFIVVVCHCW